MHIRMNTTAAGPSGVRMSGVEYHVPDPEGRALVSGRYALDLTPAAAPPIVAAESTGADPETQTETATIDPAENASDPDSDDVTEADSETPVETATIDPTENASLPVPRRRKRPA